MCRGRGRVVAACLGDADGGEPVAERVAWLSLVKEEGDGLRAALLFMTEGGEPAGFRFTRAFPRRADGQADGDGGSVATQALKRLLRAASPPSLVLGLQGEVPDGALADGADSQIPLCLLAAGEGPTSAGYGRSVDGRLRPEWRSRPERGWTVVRRLLDAIMEWDDPLEPFRRAADGLSVAFEDEHVRALMGERGLVTVVDLDPPAGAGDYAADAASVAEQGYVAERREATLAQRLWAVLRSPVRDFG